MTVIVGLVDDGKVFIGADSASIEEDGHIRIVNNRKAFTNGGCVIGSAGSWRQIELLSRMDVPDPFDSYDTEDADLYMADILMPAVKEAFAAAGMTECSPFLVGVLGRLFIVDSDFHVEEQSCGYSAVGAGAPWALGALFAGEHGAEMRVDQALRSAEFACSSVRGPFHIEVV